MKSLFPVVYVLLCLIAAHSFAGSATWNVNPTSGLWNTAANWTPATVPNGPTDIATFASSSLTNLSISAGIEVNSIVFGSGAPAFTINNTQGVGLTISGAGVTNNSGVLQNFVNQGAGQLYFTNAATAGDSVTYINSATGDGKIEFQGSSTAGSATYRATGAIGGDNTQINFHDQASAGTAVFNNERSGNGVINFYDSSTADHATITNEPNFASSVWFWNSSTAGSATIINKGDGSFWGNTYFRDSSNAGESMITVDGSVAREFGYAYLIFYDNSSAANGTFIANGGQRSGAGGGNIYLQDFASADNGTFIANPGIVSGAFGGRVIFNLFTAPTGATATLIANGGIGTGGGGIAFEGTSLGGQARVQVYGNGFLTVEQHVNVGITIGSLEGDGLVFLGGATLSIGSNNLSTTFSGVIEGNSTGFIGRLTKVGAANLTLTGANTYFGTTTIEEGKLVVNNTTGSGTGSGQVQIKDGWLGGIGTIAGAVIVGTGSGAKAILAPGQKKGRPDTLTIQSPLTFNSNGVYQCEVNSRRAVADKVVANGITINGGRFTLRDSRGFVLPPGTVFTVIDNTSANQISGIFSNLADGATVVAGSNTYQANYEGGDGNDLTLTVVP